MQASKEIDGWSALSNISTFMSHVEDRKKLSIFGQLSVQLDYCQYLIRTQIHQADQHRARAKKRKYQLTSDRIRALKTLKIEELICHYSLAVEQLTNLTNSIFTAPPFHNSFLIIEGFTRSYNLKIWKKKKLRFDRQNHIIYAQKDKKIKIYDLGNYLVRKSSCTDYICLVLEAINTIPLVKSKTVHIGFEFKNNFNLWFQSIKISTCYKQWLRFAEILHKKQEIQKHNLLYKQAEQASEYKVENKEMVKEEVKKYVQQQGNGIVSREVSEVLETSKYSMVQNDNYLNKSAQLQNGDCPSILSQSIDLNEMTRRCFIYRLMNETLKLTTEQLQFELQKEPELMRRIKRKINLQQILLGKFTLNRIGHLSNFQSIELCLNGKEEFAGEVYMFQNVNNHCNYKFFYLSPLGSIQKGYSKDDLFKKMLDPQLANSINKSLQKLSIKSVIYSENATINLQQHAPYNRLYRPRQFTYIRHITKNAQGELFIIDRSIDQEMIPKSDPFVRGTLFNVTRISQNQHQIMVTIDLTFQNKGELLNHQEANHSKRYMNNLAVGLSEYFSNRHQSSIKVSLYDYDFPLLEDNDSDDGQVEEAQHQTVFDFTNPERSFEQSFQIYPSNPNGKIDSPVSRIPRTNLLLEKNKIMGSIYAGNHEKEITPIRRTYEPPRRVNKDYLNPRLSFSNVKGQEYFDSKSPLIPEWTVEWSADEQNGGLIHKPNNMKQKQILKEVLECASKITLTTNDNFSKLSSPVDILAPESSLERLVKALSYAPSLFEHASKLTTIQGLKKTVVFGIATTLLSLKINKPFMPLLGETYQSEIPSSCQGYGEQISPTKTALYLIGKYFEISSVIEPKVKVVMNSTTGYSQGVYRVKLKGKKQISFTTPSGQLTGLVDGNLKFLILGKSYYWIQEQCILLELDFQVNHSFSISAQSKADCFKGTIYQVTPEFMVDFVKSRVRPDEQQIVKVIEKISGRWTKNITFEDETVQLDKIVLFEMNSKSNSLPSDSSFREDINRLKLSHLEQSQAAKETLEVQKNKHQRL